MATWALLVLSSFAKVEHRLGKKRRNMESLAISFPRCTHVVMCLDFISFGDKQYSDARRRYILVVHPLDNNHLTSPQCDCSQEIAVS